MRSSSIAIALVVLLSGATIHAQDDAGVGDAEGEADAGIAATEDEPPAAGAIIPPIDPKFRAATDRRYEIMAVSGVILEVVGVAALVVSFSFAMGALFAFNNCNVESQVVGCEERAAKTEKRDRTVAWVAMPVGVVAVAVGTPLLVKGARGHHRLRKLLGRKAEILGTAHLTGLLLTMFSSRESTASGLMLSGSF